MAAVLALFVASAASAQIVKSITPDQDLPADDGLRQALVDSICAGLRETYVFPDVAEKMEKRLRDRLRRSAYDEAETIALLTRMLTDDLREVSGDLHLGVHFLTEEEVEAMRQSDEDDDEHFYDEMGERMRRQNYRFRKAEVLDGNVGYLRLDNFVDTRFSGETAVAAMNFLAHCDALIVDLRWNGGGSPSLIQLMMGYLLEEPTHLNSFYIRKDDSTKQFWSLPHTPGPSLAGVDLYVLIGPRTGSAAEEFAYNVQALERGTLVGEVTWGGAHPIDRYTWKSLHAGAHIPFGRAINPITGTNWEGVGVQPDMKIATDRALDAAHIEALKKIRENEEDPRYGATLDWAIGSLEGKANPVEIDPAVLESYAGVYEDRVLTVEGGVLVYKRGDRPAMRGTPLTATLFQFDEVPFFRLEVVIGDDGVPTRLRGHYDNGMIDESRRTGG